MDLFDTVKAAAAAAGLPDGAFETLPPGRWDKVSINGHQTAKVTGHGIGLKGGVAWTFFTFVDDGTGKIHTLWGSEDASTHPTISLADGEHNDASKGAALASPRIAIQPLVVFPVVKVSVRFKFTDATGTAMEYRFDGRSWP